MFSERTILFGVRRGRRAPQLAGDFDEKSNGLFADTVGSVAPIVLAIPALSGVAADFLLAAATIVFAARRSSSHTLPTSSLEPRRRR